MKRGFEKFLSYLLFFLIILVFLGNILLTAFNIKAIEAHIIWDISFLLSWLIMLIYPVYIFMEKNSKFFSIFTAIITGIAFVALSYHGVLVLSRFLPIVNKHIIISEKILVDNRQAIFYTSLILVYLLHLINIILINRDKKITEEKK